MGQQTPGHPEQHKQEQNQGSATDSQSTHVETEMLSPCGMTLWNDNIGLQSKDPHLWDSFYSESFNP